MVRVDLRTVVMDVPPQDVISRDNVSVKVNAVLYFRVVDPEKAIIQVENFFEATSQLAQTTLRSVLGKHELDEMLAERDKLNLDIQKILDAQTDAWGIKVANVEIKHVDLDETMVRAIARQAEAERERRAKVIHAEGELQAAEKLREAARDAGAAAAGDAAALPADADRHRRREELDDRLPAADGADHAADEDARRAAGGRARRAAAARGRGRARRATAPRRRPRAATRRAPGRRRRRRACRRAHPAGRPPDDARRCAPGGTVLAGCPA